MNNARRVSMTVALLLALSGCNNVVSIDPWFTEADARNLPTFREGLWLRVADADCRVDAAKPAERWPDCAEAWFVRGNEWWRIEWHSTPRGRTFAGWIEDTTLMVDGEPLIGQIEVQEVSLPSGVATTGTETEEPDWRYFYFALRPTRFDERGNVVAFENWGISCGPPSETALNPRDRVFSDGELAEDVSAVTERPFPGLTVIGGNCTAESADALRRAATLSEPLETGSARWIRDGWR